MSEEQITVRDDQCVDLVGAERIYFKIFKLELSLQE
jgi:hypothetical protein